MLKLTDEQLDWLAKRIPDTPRSPKGGRPPADKRRTLRGIFWMLDNGAKWKDLPREFGSKSTVHRWFQKWVRQGLFERVMRAAGRLVERRGAYRVYECFIDATFSKARGGGDGIGCTKVGKGVKITVLVDARGLPVAIDTAPADRHESRLVRDITPADADAWRAWLAEHEKLSPATVARRVIAARTIWRKAVRWKLARENPFDGVKGGHQANESRKRFIAGEHIDSALAEAPDAEWRAIIALARYGGLRTPSETFALRWGDIDWDRGMIHVSCPKLAHRENHASRVIPLFPELREPLLTLFAEAEPGTEYVIARHRLGCANLRTQFERIIRRAGLKPWPRLFHNLRASGESELMREYDLATVCRWIGNSPAVAAKHYATSIDLDADFRRAAGLPSEAQQKAQQSASADGGQGETREQAEHTETPEKQGSDTLCHSHASAVEAKGWALQDSNL
jgi:transposase